MADYKVIPPNPDKEKTDELLKIVASAILLLQQGGIPLVQFQAAKYWFEQNAPQYLRRK